MKAKDTVIKLEERILADYPDLDACLEAQAEISFKAGYEAHKNEACGNCDTPLIREGELYQKLDKAKMAGIKEVVEWFREKGYLVRKPDNGSPLGKKFKEWGIEEEK